MKAAIAATSIGFTVGGVSATSRGLGQILLSRAALVTIAGLLIYSGSELAFDPPSDLLNFVAHHFVHVAVIGLGAWFACWLALRNRRTGPRVFYRLHLTIEYRPLPGS